MPNKLSPFIVILKDETKTESYRVSEHFFNVIKETLTPFRSEREQAKPVKCIETNMIFKTAGHAADWLQQNGLTENYKAQVIIKKACRSQEKKAYGYHWEYVKN